MPPGCLQRGPLSSCAWGGLLCWFAPCMCVAGQGVDWRFGAMLAGMWSGALHLQQSEHPMHPSSADDLGTYCSIESEGKCIWWAVVSRTPVLPLR